MGKAPKPTKGLGQRIAQARELARISQTELSKGAGVTRSAVSQWESEGTEPTPENLRAIALETSVNYEWLATGRGEMLSDVRSEDVARNMDRPSGARSMQIKGYVGANGTTGFYTLAHDSFEVLPAGPMDPPNAVALEIMGTSAGRWFNRGFAVYSDVRSPVTEDMIGKPCVVWLPDGRVLLKEIRRNGKFFDLLSNDSGEPPIEKVKIVSAAKVLRFIHR